MENFTSTLPIPFHIGVEMCYLKIHFLYIVYDISYTMVYNYIHPSLTFNFIHLRIFQKYINIKFNTVNYIFKNPHNSNKIFIMRLKNIILTFLSKPTQICSEMHLSNHEKQWHDLSNHEKQWHKLFILLFLSLMYLSRH